MKKNPMKTPSPYALLLLAALLAAALFPVSAEAARKDDIQKTADRRTIFCWVEGAVFEDLVMNARGRLSFLYVDSRMGGALQKLRTSGSREDAPAEFSEMLLAYTGQYAARKGQILFAVQIVASKPWTFDTSLIHVGGFTPAPDDFVTAVRQNPEAELRHGITELPSGYEGILSFYVPASQLKPGTEIEIGYGEDKTAWRVPAKNE